MGIEIKTYRDLESKEAEIYNKEVDLAVARLTGSDDWDGSGRGSKLYRKELGICNGCKNLRAAVTRHDKLYAYCETFEKSLNGYDEVVECTAYNARGSLSLWDMKDMAYVIEAEKRKAGFV